MDPQIDLKNKLAIATDNIFFERYKYPEYFAINLAETVPKAAITVEIHSILKGSTAS